MKRSERTQFKKAAVKRLKAREILLLRTMQRRQHRAKLNRLIAAAEIGHVSGTDQVMSNWRCPAVMPKSELVQSTIVKHVIERSERTQIKKAADKRLMALNLQA